MSIVNKKGGFFRTIEINRDSVESSQTTLIEPILKQAENYTAQVQRFVTNITPQVNTFQTPFLTILSKPVPGDVGTVDTIEDAENEYGFAMADPVQFIPTNIYSVTELARQLSVFCEIQGGLTTTLNPDFKITITMNKAFGHDNYIKIDPVYAHLLGLEEYLFYFRARVPRDPGDATAGTPVVVTSKNHLWLALDELEDLEFPKEQFFHFRPALPFLESDPSDHAFVSQNTLFNCDTRQYIDISFTMPHISQITVLDGNEEHKKLLARFPLKDFLETEHVSFNDYDTYGVRETINMGLEDLCRGNPDVHTMLLLPGDIQHANIRIETTYMQNKKFVTIPTDFGTHGFWSLKLILAKKVK